MKLSVITVCRNDKEGLERTILSLLSQSNPSFEIIVLDGASCDGTTEVLQRYAQRIDYWRSEPDSGIYNAMNKAVKVAKGYYCLFMNAGDVFFDSEVVARFLAADPTEDIVSGKEVCSFDGRRYVAYRKPPKDPDTLFFMRQTLAHQSTFIRTDLLRKYPYDETFRIASDYIFFFQSLILEDASYRRMDFFVAKFRMNGISSTQGNLSMQERAVYLERIFPGATYRDWAFYAHYYNLFSHLKRRTLTGKFLRFFSRILFGLEVWEDKIVLRRVNRILRTTKEDE